MGLGVVTPRWQIPNLDLLFPDALKVHAGEIEVAGQWLRVFKAVGYPRRVETGWMMPLLQFPWPLAMALYTAPIPTGAGLQDLGRRLIWQRGSEVANRHLGRLTNPHQETAIEDAERLRRELARGDTKLLEVSLYLGVWAKTREELEHVTELLEGVTRGMLLVLRRMRFQQLQGLQCLLPTGKPVAGREMDSQAWATLFPFATQSLAHPAGQTWGTNPANQSLVIVDRFRMPSPHSVTIGWSGAGKSYFAKLDALRSRYRGWDVAVIDPEGEYRVLKSCGAAVVTIGEGGTSFPYDPFYVQQEGEWEWHVDFLSRLCRRLAPGWGVAHDSAWLRAAWKVLGEGAGREVTYAVPGGDRLPAVLTALSQRHRETAELVQLARVKWKRLTGEAVDPGLNQSSFVVWNLQRVPPGDKGAVYLALAEWISRQTRLGRRRLVIFDEAWHLLNEPETSRYLEELFRRARKWNTALSLVTQDFGDFVRHAAAEVCLRNAPLVMLLRQHPESLNQLAQALHLHAGELQYLAYAAVGEGILIAGDDHLRIKVWAAPEEARVLAGQREDAS